MKGYKSLVLGFGGHKDNQLWKFITEVFIQCPNQCVLNYVRTLFQFPVIATMLTFGHQNHANFTKWTAAASSGMYSNQSVFSSSIFSRLQMDVVLWKCHKYQDCHYHHNHHYIIVRIKHNICDAYWIALSLERPMQRPYTSKDTGRQQTVIYIAFMNEIRIIEVIPCSCHNALK